MDGVIILDKPAGISSHDAVQKLRKITGVKRIGHLGTLDPLGAGVLPMVLGRATRLARFFLNTTASMRQPYDSASRPTPTTARVKRLPNPLT